VSKLKYLEYLNLSMNNVQTIEGLSGCESLKKLDLTMNFIPVRNLIQITELKANHQLRELFLTGNPCTDFEGYRSYTIAESTAADAFGWCRNHVFGENCR
jgi:protein TilB